MRPMRPAGRYCDQEKVKVLNRELNMTKDAAVRDWGFAYILWLECGCLTPMPEKTKRLTKVKMAAIKARIDAMNLLA